MKNYYLVFTKEQNETFVGFTSIEPSFSSSKAYEFLKVSKESYKEAIVYIETDHKLELNYNKDYFVAIKKL